MKKQSIIRIFLLVVVITAAVFVGAAVRNSSPLSNNTEECLQDKQECLDAKNQSEFLLESLTKHLLGR